MTKYWLLVTDPNNFEVMKAKNIAAMKARRKNFAEKVEPGDKVVFYLTKIGKFGGVAEFKSKSKYDEKKMFPVEKPGETHPWRFDIKFEVKLPEDKYVSAEEFKEKLVYLKKWPAKYWKLGFQGNIHEIPKEDYETLNK
ncbi:MAG: EVE domain-containing protein [Candidatus Curtissbacteria bacterium]|nr:EVE domain-containing protein [Candidatus Curtissbacteria bacterium]